MDAKSCTSVFSMQILRQRHAKLNHLLFDIQVKTALSLCKYNTNFLTLLPLFLSLSPILFFPFFLPSFHHSFIPFILPSFLPSFPPFFLTNFLPSFLPTNLHSTFYLPSFLLSFSFLSSIPSKLTHLKFPMNEVFHI